MSFRCIVACLRSNFWLSESSSSLTLDWIHFKKLKVEAINRGQSPPRARLSEGKDNSDCAVRARVVPPRPRPSAVSASAQARYTGPPSRARPPAVATAAAASAVVPAAAAVGTVGPCSPSYATHHIQCSHTRSRPSTHVTQTHSREELIFEYSF